MVYYRKNKELDTVFSALADATRRDIVLSLSKRKMAVGLLAEKYSMSLTGVRKHIHVLEDAGFVSVEKSGRTNICQLHPQKFKVIVNQLKIYESFWQQSLKSFAKKMEK